MTLAADASAGWTWAQYLQAFLSSSCSSCIQLAWAAAYAMFSTHAGVRAVLRSQSSAMRQRCDNIPSLEDGRMPDSVAIQIGPEPRTTMKTSQPLRCDGGE